ncbi:hypothetical protein [Mucilaginibacter gynuensis]|uniref:hypothetical protein n=1 Tax=Mucilaginibacter gynuensis TaxID=1302236 RepID=UPI0031F0015D
MIRIKESYNRDQKINAYDNLSKQPRDPLIRAQGLNRRPVSSTPGFKSVNVVRVSGS